MYFLDQSRAYLCKNFACSAPVETPEELVNLILQEWQKEDPVDGNFMINSVVNFIGKKYIAINDKVMNIYRE